ncbi:hypothetical protein CRG98_029851 [Punica granatum]|uniref:Uncharacterized protein n=1 Tax=Punica granatum TaxID=22663 RepID=A0A2I0J0K2_PUNGR|nr:hypothetical protein CRG98_029851 [Punica granatum]
MPQGNLASNVYTSGELALGAVGGENFASMGGLREGRGNHLCLKPQRGTRGWLCELEKDDKLNDKLMKSSGDGNGGSLWL